MSMIEIEKKAFTQFKKIMDSGYLDGIVVYDLVNALTYAIESEDKVLVEALEVVLQYYTNGQEYANIIDEVLEPEGYKKLDLSTVLCDNT